MPSQMLDKKKVQRKELKLSWEYTTVEKCIYIYIYLINFIEHLYKYITEILSHSQRSKQVV